VDTTGLYCTPEHFRQAEELVRKTRAAGGLAPVDLDRFWADQEAALKDPFGRAIPQVPLGIMMNGECVYDELGVAEDHWRYQNDEEWRLGLNKAYNDKAERIVGRRLLSEERRDPTREYPATKGLHDVFEARQEWHEHSWWLMQSANTPDELRALLDRVEQRWADLRSFLLPENWDDEKRRLLALGIRAPLYQGQRGPVTFAMSVYGAENLIFLIQDEPDLAARFRDAIAETMVRIARIMQAEAGYTPADAPRGFGFADDNCALLNREMYEFFGAPILKRMWDTFSPDPDDPRSQHSDSSMSHLLPVLGGLGIRSTNFGPDVKVSDIRRHCPKAVIHGELAPFTFSRNEEVKIVAEFLRDHEMTRDSRGLVFYTAGSINNGSRLTGMRLIMSAIQHLGRYDR